MYNNIVIRGVLGLGLLGLCTSAMATVKLPVAEVKFDQAYVVFNRQTAGLSKKYVRIEAATSWEQEERGLMYRSSLAANAGMIFVNDAEDMGAFWMKNTLIPLDIAFFDKNGVIRDILQMKPCLQDPCQIYRPKHAFLGSIEMNWGWFAANRVQVGDKVRYTIYKNTKTP